MKNSRAFLNRNELWRIIPIILFVFYAGVAIGLPIFLNFFARSDIAEIESITRITVNVATGIAGIWALYTYRRSKKADASRWMYQLYGEFYSDQAYFKIRDLFEYGYEDSIRPLVELRVTDRNIKLNSEQIGQIRQLDLLLNFFEHLLYLEEAGIILQRDREVFFEYWFGFFEYPQRSGLRKYFVHCGYERLASYMSVTTRIYLGISNDDEQIVDKLEEFLAKNESVAVELNDSYRLVPFVDFDYSNEAAYRVYQLESFGFLRDFDGIIGCISNDPENSTYTRTCLSLYGGNEKPEKSKDVWVYLSEKERI